MPQLNPRPWLFLLLAVWVIFSTLALPGILKTKYPHLPNVKSPENVSNLKTGN